MVCMVYKSVFVLFVFYFFFLYMSLQCQHVLPSQCYIVVSFSGDYDYFPVAA